MAEENERVPDNGQAAMLSPFAYDPGDWQPVYHSQTELNAALSAFSEAVSGDVRLFAEARRRSEELLMRGD